MPATQKGPGENTRNFSNSNDDDRFLHAAGEYRCYPSPYARATVCAIFREFFRITALASGTETIDVGSGEQPLGVFGEERLPRR